MDSRAYRIAAIAVVAAVIVGGVWWKRAHRPEGAGTGAATGPSSTDPGQSAAFQDSDETPASLPSLIEFGMGKCQQCKNMKPIIQELAQEYEGRVDIREVDIGAQPAEAERHDVVIIPAQVFLDAEGNEVYRHEGFMPKEDIVSKLEEMGVG